MSKPLAEAHPELFHYTSAAGLSGIVKSQTLWATHYAYLNDAQEVRHFLVSRLPEVLRPVIATFLAGSITQAPEQQALADHKGGIHSSVEDILERMVGALLHGLLDRRDGEPPLAEPYITSFCAAADPKAARHGLLSQWRGYGRDGAYALVFDTAALSRLLREEGEKWGHDVFGGEVVYSSDSDQKVQAELEQDENQIKNWALDLFTADGHPDAPEKMYTALMQCACRYKHWGFKEENEVRIVAIPNSRTVRDLARAEDLVLAEKPCGHFMRCGTPVPYIQLFAGMDAQSGMRLPLKRVIVGPHPDKKERARAVEILLGQHGIQAEVSASDIPYLG